MIGTKKPLTQKKSLLDKEFNLDKKQQLIARWQKVDGKLICQWVMASIKKTE